ncbi:MAG: ATP-dependent RecD-like DNA helicase [Anaerolineae bacterium]
MDALTGTIERVTYHNEENGYTVAQLAPEGKDYTVPVVGNMLGINVGEYVELRGQWTAHPQYGRQFKADSFKLKLPATAVGIEKYLGSGLIKGVGPVTAKRIVRLFGAQSLQVIDEEPQRLRTVLGVGPKRASLIQDAWRQQRAIREVMFFLQEHSVSTGLAVKIYKQYGDGAVGIVRNDPYRLARDIHGIGFITADKIAQALGLALDAPERVAAGVAHVLGEQADDGHVYVPQTILVMQAAEMLAVPSTLVVNAIEQLRQEEAVHVERILMAPASERRPPASPALVYEVVTASADPAAASVPEAELTAPASTLLAEERAVYLVPFYRGEIGVAGRLRRLCDGRSDCLALFQRFDWDAAFAAVQQETGLALAPAQREAVQASLTQPLVVLTGGPGTGKTFTVQTIIRLLEASGHTYALASPTGRAAKRLSETTGRPAKTIHRLLEFKPSGGVTFQINENNPLEVDILVVDEASMLDLLLMNHLLKAVPPGAHLLLVGDVDQLPSVGAGSVLKDIIESGTATVVRLQTIFRQAAGSFIVENAHRINRGQMPEWQPAQSQDFFLFKVDDAEQAANLVVEIVAERIPRRFGVPAADVQVLTPMHRGVAGVANLNLLLQARLNPPDAAKPERRLGGHIFRVGDRVMQTRNNYNKDVFNGDLGEIVRLDGIEQVLTVRSEGREIDYSFLELDELTHAYAISVHKAQGSEYPAVVLPLLTQHYMMLQRNLLYTAVTRARRLVVLVGMPRAIAIAVNNNKIAERYTGLAARLQ